MTSPLDFHTPGRIIREAMIDAGLLQRGEEPTSDDYSRYMGRLSDLVNMWQTQGLKLWVNEVISITLVAGTGSYFLGPGGTITTTKPLRVIDGYYISSGNERTPLTSLSWQRYNTLSNTTQTGAISSYLVDKQLTNLRVAFWQVPDAAAATGRVDLLIQGQVTEMISLNDRVSFPQEWYVALRWGLADDICSGQSQAIQARCMEKARAFRQALEDWDVEDASTFIQPDFQGMGGNPFI